MSQQHTSKSRQIGHEHAGDLPDRAELKSERVQYVLQQKVVQEQVAALIMKLASCDRQRVRIDLAGGKVILSVQAVPSPCEMEEVAEAAFALAQEAA